MTGQDLLNIMEDLNAELQLQAGEANVAKGLRALNAAQDMFELILARQPDVKGGQVGTVTTSNQVEYTAFPTGVLRVDRLQLLDPSTLRPVRDLDNVKRVGGHVNQSYWPNYLTANVTSGAPAAYWTNGRRIYWDPLPSGTHTVRWYGFQSDSDITASGTFGYDDAAAYPLATVASQIIKVGLDDPAQDMMGLAEELFTPLFDTLIHFNRDEPEPYNYRYQHDT